MYLTIICFPLFASLLANNRYCGNKGGPLLSVILMKFGAIFSLFIFFEVGLSGSPVSIEMGNWIDYGNLLLEWNLYYDTLTASMYLPIVIISFLIQIYSLEYMGHDPHKARFFSILSLFAVAMLILVTGENLLIILLGWELVGIVSYLLVNFWFTRLAANMASLSALFLNKIGDMFFIIGLILSIAIFSDLSLSTIYSLAIYMNGNIIFLLSISIILAGAAKSALIPFTPWLAKAMEGPTSVSALLHSSTMVTAGVYLFMRISPLLELSSSSLIFILWLGSLGALFGAMCGLVDNDIKRIIAFSTMSQLGYMVVAVGISQYHLALFHLLMHAVFKSLLFLSSGAILHALLDNQNLIRMGSLNLMLPLTYLVFFFASLSLMAFPFTAGFYSKDFLLELLCVPLYFSHSLAYIFTLFAALLTSTYSIRVLMIAMMSRPLFPKAFLPFVIDSSFIMTFPLLILSFGAVTLGYFTHQIFLPFGSTFYLNSLFILPNAPSSLFDASFGGSIISLIPVTFLFLILLILIISPFNNNIHFNNSSNIIFPLLPSKKYKASFNFTTHFTLLNYFNVFYHWLMFYALYFSNIIFRYLDKGSFENFGPLGLLNIIHYFSNKIENLATGYIPHYAFIVIISVLIFLIFN